MSRTYLVKHHLECICIYSHFSITSEDGEKMCVWFQSMVQKERIKGDREGEGDGLLDYLSYECQRTWKRKSCIKYAAVQIRMPGEVRREGGSEPLLCFKLSALLVLWQPLSSVANLFWHFPWLRSDIFSWPFLCCLTSFILSFLASHSPRSCWGNCLILAGSVCHDFTVLSLSNWSSHGHKRIQIHVLMDGQVHGNAPQPEFQYLWGLTVYYSVFIWEIWL